MGLLEGMAILGETGMGGSLCRQHSAAHLHPRAKGQYNRDGNNG